MEWIELYPKSKKPRIEDIEAYLNQEGLRLFKIFVEYLANNLKLTYVAPKFLITSGWSLQIGRSGMIMVRDITFRSNIFYVNGISVQNDSILNEVISSMEEMYNREFVSAFSEYSRKRSEEQKQRSKRRRQRDEEFISNIKDKIDPSKLDVYRWSPCVSRQKLLRLYEGDSRDLLDKELLDDVGYTIYARCLQSQEERKLIDEGKLKCHNCGNNLLYKPGLISCSCGHNYIFKNYMKSFRTNNMPSGAAQHIFDHFIDKWPLMQTDADKMALIDWVIHEFHINIRSGVKGRPVGINLIQGTNSQVKKLILNLAYGDTGIASSENYEYWVSNAKL